MLKLRPWYSFSYTDASVYTIQKRLNGSQQVARSDVTIEIVYFRKITLNIVPYKQIINRLSRVELKKKTIDSHFFF